MNCQDDNLNVNGVKFVRLESNFLRADVVPSLGGRVISIFEKKSQHEYLWRNPTLQLQQLKPGSDYDFNFYGGIDELLPNDIPETIGDVSCPDHGELWTLPLDSHADQQSLLLRGTLPSFGLEYGRLMSLRKDCSALDISYRIQNAAKVPRPFLWKLHAAISIQAGDILDCPAGKAQVVDPKLSRFSTLAPFTWPICNGISCNTVPPKNGTLDFFYLFDLHKGRVAWQRPETGLEFCYEFDPTIFPYVWLFASYGGFNGHYTVILEPCTCMPISVNAATRLQQCAWLEPGQALETHVTIRAGKVH